MHLSDIHIKSVKEGVLSNADKIGSAIRSRNDGADLVVCVVTGDISFSGKAEQFEIAREFFTNIAASVGSVVHFAMVPGNHDLDHDRPNAAREALVKSVLQSPGEKIDTTIVEVLAKPQRAFFEFRDKMHNEHDALLGDCVAYCYKFNGGNGEFVAVRCVNTALLSSLKEKPASLLIPSQIADDLQNQCFTITAFHHPYNWLNPASKAVVRALEHNSDLILTGHEHEHDRTVKYRPESYVATTYIEAAALQEHFGSDESAFNVLLVDTKKGEYKFFHFEWNGALYASVSVIGDWERLPLQSARAGGIREVTSEFSARLNDAGIPVEASRGRRILSDIYLYPNLLEAFSDPTLKQKRAMVGGEDVFRTIERKAITFISGPPKSGRTSLARKLFLDFTAAGYVPLYLDGIESGMRATDGIPPVVQRHVKIQYGEKCVEAYFQLLRDRRVIIADNAERIKGRRLDRIRFVENLAGLAAHVVLLGDDSAGGITEMHADDIVGAGDQRASYVIQEFNHLHREEFAQRWFSGDDVDEGETSRRLEHAGRILDTVIGRNYVPAYPIYIIAVLQAVEEGGAVDPKASTHGYFYDLLIRQALTARSETKDVGIRMAFLTHLASEMYAAGAREILESELRDSFRRYDEKYAVGGLEYEKLATELIDRGMLMLDGDTVRFRYPYLYFYFVANHFSRNISDSEVRAEVKRLTENLSDDQASDILMFLAHLSHDSFVIDSLLATAHGYLRNYEAETLETLTKGGEEELQLSYVEHESQGQARRELAMRRDAQISQDRAAGSERGDLRAAEAEVETLAALHTIRVMGQIIKNFPGVLTKETKVAVLEASCDLGLRLLSLALREVGVARKEVIDRISEVIRRLSPDMPEDRLQARAEHYLWVLSIATAYGILRVIIASLSAQELEPIYDREFSGKVSPARRLISLGLRLDISRSFPEGLVTNVADELKGVDQAGLLVKLFVLNYLERIYVPREKRQSVCAKLGIRYEVLPASKVLALKRGR